MSNDLTSATFKQTLFRVKIIDNYDPPRPSWAKENTVFLYDHPNTYVGHLTKHFYGNSVNVGDEIPSWTYDTISNHGFDASSWNTHSKATSNRMPPNSGPVPNTQGVYSGQEALLGKELSNYKISDIDVLRFWPAGRPNAYGGFPPYQIYNSSTDNVSTVAGATVISQGISDNSNTSPYTYVYLQHWQNDCKYLPLTVPSYMHNSGEDNTDYELYPKIPELGMWPSGGKDLGIDNWSWTTKSTTKMYGRFCNAWHQNLSSSQKRNMSELTNHPYGTTSNPTKEHTYQKSCGTDGSPGVAPATDAQGLTIVAGSTDDTDAGEAGLFLLDTMWDTTYYVGGFYIENKGLAYHLRNAVNWENLGTSPSIGNIDDFNLTNSREATPGNIYDGNVGPIPPLMTFEGAGAIWSSSLKNNTPYNKYLDYQEELDKLNQYYSNESINLRCEIIDGPSAGAQIVVSKPRQLIITNKQTQRICPEYNQGEELLVQKASGPEDFAEYVDLNIGAKKLIDYSTKGTLEPYFDYFPDNYIPFETDFLLPTNQKIPPYSFNCSTYTYSDEIKLDNEGSQGSKGEKGITFGTAGDGVAGGAGDTGGDGEDGDDGAGGDANTAEKGQKGAVVTNNGDQGTGIITGSFGAVNAERANYTLASNGTISQHLGVDAANPDTNWATTVSFTRQYFGVAVEDIGSSPGCNYSGMYMWASDFVD